CQTSLPGVLISGNLPRLATQLHQISLIRTLHHEGPATHATGHCLFQTGSLPSQFDVTSASGLAPALTSLPWGANSVILGQSAHVGRLRQMASSETHASGAVDDVAMAKLTRVAGLEAIEFRMRDRIEATFGSSELGMNCWRA